MSRRRLVSQLATAAALLCLAPTAACRSSEVSSTGPSASSSLPPVGEVPQVLATSQLRLPLDTYLLTLDEEARRNAARRSLLAGCMRRFGVKTTIPEPPRGVGLNSLNERRYGLTDAREAATTGYGLGDRDPRARGGGRDAASAMTPRALAVLTGEGKGLPAALPEGGCSGEVGRLLQPVDPTTKEALDDALPQRLSLETFGQSQNDPRVQAAFAEWSACMRAEGHDYKTPLDPPADPGFSVPGGAQERRTAQDDVACKRATNLVGRWYAVEVAYQTRLVESSRPELVKLAEAEAVVTRFVATVTPPR